MLAQTLRVHFQARSWRPSRLLSHRRQDPFVRSLLTWFADYPDSSGLSSPYSLHNMVATGHAKYEKLPGEWYGPQTACFVVRDLVDLHAMKQSSARNGDCQGSSPQRQRNTKPLFRVHVAEQGSVYRDQLRERMASDYLGQQRAKPHLAASKKVPSESLVPTHPLEWADELVHSEDACEYGEPERPRAPWDTACLLLVPLRLGLHSFSSDYIPLFTFTFSLPQSVGVLGGRPRGARWFYGAFADGSKVLGLDPHTVQPSQRRRYTNVNGTPGIPVVDISDEYLRSVHAASREVCAINRMDPSLALGFYCRDCHDFEDLVSALQLFRDQHPGTPELFSVCDVSPSFMHTEGLTNDAAGVASSVASLSSSSDNSVVASSDLKTVLGNEDDDEEYVVL
jgi:cysteine protease ATG4